MLISNEILDIYSYQKLLKKRCNGSKNAIPIRIGVALATIDVKLYITLQTLFQTSALKRCVVSTSVGSVKRRCIIVQHT